MNTSSLSQRLAVCSWSLQPTSPQDLITKLPATGVRRVQLALGPLRDEPAVWGQTPELLQAAGISIASGMFGCVGEDYSTLDTIRVTGGLVPDATWEQNWKNIQATTELARRLDLKYVMFHAGFLPHDEKDLSFAKLKQRLLQVADAFQARGIALGLETGQESASVLVDFLQKLNRPNVGANFDPANMILYGTGEPLPALRKIGSHVKSVHCKDAKWSDDPGVAWGTEMPLGQGEVDIALFIFTLKEIGYLGPLTIEREVPGEQQKIDIRNAVELLRKLT